ncbi:transposase [Streptomyces sp. NBC_01077]|uniref:transposase n=1 Tax=Streptomyces sp. NBC_01077 TaxID=2903746 RepID=UPI00386D7CA7
MTIGAGRSAEDRERQFDAAMWWFRTGSPWRDRPRRYGSWSTVDRRPSTAGSDVRSQRWPSRNSRTSAVVKGPAPCATASPSLSRT